MKQILLPTDFSAHAENALKVAAQIAQKCNGEVIIAHILELPNHGNDAILGGTSIPETMLFMKKAKERMNSLCEKPYLKNVAVSEIIRLDKTSEGIVNICKDYPIDLIIMGSNGSIGYDELLIGSNTEKLVRDSNIPVLVIKKEIEDFKVNDMVFASDFTKKIESSFKKVVEVAKFFNTTIHLVMINTPNIFHTNKKADELMNNFIQKFELRKYTKTIYNDTNVEQGILNFAKSINADLIGMCTHGRKGISHFFNGSISEGLVNHTVRPVITFKM